MFLLKKSPLIAPSILAITMFSSSAFATTTDYSGKITVTAKTATSPCVLDTTDTTSALDFGEVAVGGQPANTEIAEKPFTIELTSCPVDAGATIKTSFSGVTMLSNGDIEADPTGGTGNEVYFQILDGSGAVITPDTASTPVTVSNDTNHHTIIQTYYAKAMRSSGSSSGHENVYVNYEVSDS